MIFFFKPDLAKARRFDTNSEPSIGRKQFGGIIPYGMIFSAPPPPPNFFIISCVINSFIIISSGKVYILVRIQILLILTTHPPSPLAVIICHQSPYPPPPFSSYMSSVVNIGDVMCELSLCLQFASVRE